MCAAARSRRDTKHANRVRIVGGAWRSRLVKFPDRANLRPTPDRVRETLFNWLGQDLTGAVVLDLFAGSGVLGIEAASRRAQHVVLVERDPVSCRALEENCRALAAHQVEVVRADALEFLTRDRTRYDVVFLDPPFAIDYWHRLLEALPDHLAPDGVVYCESGSLLHLHAGWEPYKKGRAGQVNFLLLKRTPHDSKSGLSGDV
ncbi:MAG TPA: 16S rRNA (guanine(966)-N(2))-methyltransferase RsmD [Burkholderiales bacterium]|nr:16S rRNA (guanine(966)-N(2))-methyltransferase RsmD [Burkholderiales bacterium]